ncbi:MAG: omptin family outer membrane protease [bacterium]|nr:omptin family outer membrane protease [bacterium]
MKKVAVIALMVLVMSLASSPGYSQDTTITVQPAPIPENASVVPVNTPKKSVCLGEKVDLSLSIQGKKVSGYTEYHIKFPTYVYSWDGTDWVPHAVTGHSVLVFPVDGYRIEVLANSRLKLSKKLTFIFELGVSTVLSQPKEAMVDSDYVDLSSLGSFSNWVLGATQSTVNYSNYDISITAGYPIFPGKVLDVIPMIGFQTSKNKFDVMGLAGWYNVYGYRYDLNPADYAGMNVMDYEITYNRIVTGTQVKTTNEKGVYFSLQAMYFPWVKASDYDDHLLRFKDASTEAKGKGYSIEGKIRIPIYTARNGSVWAAGGGYGILRITATGNQQQKFYADDPATTEIETDYKFDPIDNTLKLRQNSFIAFVEYKLGGNPRNRMKRSEPQDSKYGQTQRNNFQSTNSTAKTDSQNAPEVIKPKINLQDTITKTKPTSPNITGSITQQNISQDTSAIVQTAPAGQPLVTKEKSVSKWEYSVNFTGRKVSGYTEYHIVYPIVYYVYPGEGHSVLAFPTDGYHIEAAGLLNARFTKKDVMAFELAFGKTITTPKEAMVDSDYIYISHFAPPTWVYSATKSDVKYSDYNLRFTAGYPLWLNKQLKMTPLFGFQTSHKNYDVIGLSGWWEYYYMEKIPIEPGDYAGIKVLKYTVDYHQLITGLIFETTPNNGMSLYLKAYYLPYVKAKDFDDHILRNKNMSTNATGSGYQLEGRIKIQAHKFVSGAVLNFGGGYELMRIKATGSQIQKWYGDDPATDGFDDTGSVSSPIDNTLKLRQNSFNVFLEYKPY